MDMQITGDFFFPAPTPFFLLFRKMDRSVPERPLTVTKNYVTILSHIVSREILLPTVVRALSVSVLARGILPPQHSSKGPCGSMSDSGGKGPFCREESYRANTVHFHWAFKRQQKTCLRKSENFEGEFRVLGIQLPCGLLDQNSRRTTLRFGYRNQTRKIVGRNILRLSSEIPV